MQRRFFLGGLGAALAGCASPEKAAEPAALTRIRSIAPIVAIDDQFELTYVGMTVFNNERELVRVDWKVNERVQEALKSSLGRRYDIRPVSYDPAAFRGAEVTASDAVLGKPSQVAARLRGVVQPGTADAVLVVAGSQTGYLAFAREGRWVGIHHAATIFDGTSFATIGRVYSAVRCKRAICLSQEMPSRHDVTFTWRWRGEPYARMPTNVQDQIRRQLLAVVDDTVPFSLQRLGLT